jgi:hypothetical protein
VIVTIIILTIFGLATFAFLAAKAFPKVYESQSMGRRPDGRAAVFAAGATVTGTLLRASRAGGERLSARLQASRQALATRLRELGLG